MRELLGRGWEKVTEDGRSSVRESGSEHLEGGRRRHYGINLKNGELCVPRSAVSKSHSESEQNRPILLPGKVTIKEPQMSPCRRGGEILRVRPRPPVFTAFLLCTLSRERAEILYGRIQGGGKASTEARKFSMNRKMNLSE